MFKRLLLAALVLGGTAVAQDCGPGTRSVPVAVQPGTVLRAAVPPALFGFDLPWYDAQIGYWRQGALRPELLAWLKPFAGASYRYPAGSNHFEWRKAVGPVASRPPMRENYVPGGAAVAQLGPAEFLQLMAQVQGQPLWMLNVVGPGGKPDPQPERERDVAAYLHWLQAETPKLCPACAPPVFEFGNELDFGDLQWTPTQVAARTLPLLQATRKAWPQARLVVLGQTAPWDAKQAAKGDVDAQLATLLARQADGVSLHPYYDGLPVTAMLEHIQRLARTHRAHNPAAQVHITEHARWPSQPLLGRWEDNWYQASGSGGAVSSADFVLALMTEPTVASAQWHALGVQGPWQMIKWQRGTDTLYPSPVYWGQRVLRDAFLTDAVAVQPAPSATLRLVAMRGEGGRLSLMGVNRADHPLRLVPTFKGQPLAAQRGEWRELVADAKGSDNTDAAPQRFTMAQRPASGWCVAPRSVFSWLGR